MHRQSSNDVRHRLSSNLLFHEDSRCIGGGGGGTNLCEVRVFVKLLGPLKSFSIANVPLCVWHNIYSHFFSAKVGMGFTDPTGGRVGCLYEKN